MTSSLENKYYFFPLKMYRVKPTSFVCGIKKSIECPLFLDYFDLE